jgi:hypothetical protein
MQLWLSRSSFPLTAFSSPDVRERRELPCSAYDRGLNSDYYKLHWPVVDPSAIRRPLFARDDFLFQVMTMGDLIGSRKTNSR